MKVWRGPTRSDNPLIDGMLREAPRTRHSGIRLHVTPPDDAGETNAQPQRFSAPSRRMTVAQHAAKRLSSSASSFLILSLPGATTHEPTALSHSSGDTKRWVLLMYVISASSTPSSGSM